MEIRLLTASEDLQRYGDWVRKHPEGSLWQSLEWRRYQEALGRDVRIYAAMEGKEIAASALVVIDRTSFGLSTWEIPRGPLYVVSSMSYVANLLSVITNDAKQEHALCIYLSPPKALPHTTYDIRHTGRYVMPEATRVIDLHLSEDGLLNQMKQKGRYNIKLAEKHGVRVVASHDVQAFCTPSR